MSDLKFLRNLGKMIEWAETFRYILNKLNSLKYKFLQEILFFLYFIRQFSSSVFVLLLVS